MKIGILQPNYLPWLGFFEQLQRTDTFVLLDDDFYHKNDWRNRNRIKGPQGAQWLTIPVHFKYSQQPRITDVRIDQRKNWQRKHLRSIEQCYSKSRYFTDYFPVFEDAYSRGWNFLAELCLFFIEQCVAALGMEETNIIRSSSLSIDEKNQDKLIRICQKLGADSFYEGAAGRSYIDVELFKKEGIDVTFQDYRHPVYPQLFGSFVSHLSVIDLLFNVGPDSLAVLLGART